ncbi:tRNA(Met) cytidine acetyltransferase TmcA [Salinicola rhizosphaerae]|uniref:tRNA(Met) cytidine acetyltransferase TmcA n=1 Tax=Salinicola rhizosphaerae TaxID=1443141 RepID=A0ABQ3EJA7_9GAMM|nr:tRNA(Met) cytidine acetyltransferase TmcA [Salinicola rhizosphaerae]
MLARRWRGVVWIADDGAGLAAARAARWFATESAIATVAGGERRAWRSPLWVGQRPSSLDGEIPSLSHARARSRLGCEHDLVVFDACSGNTGGGGSGFDPDAFGAVSGTVKAGGWLLLLTPAHWLDAKHVDWRGDADYRRLAHWPHEPETLDARYLARCARWLRAFSALATWADGNLPSLPHWPEPVGSEGGVAVDPDCLTQDQALAVERLAKLRRRRPVVLIADRGRGKSAALGIAAARRLRAGESRLWVTSPSVDSVEALFARLAALLPCGVRREHRFEVVIDGRNCCVAWLAPEAVVPALADASIDRHAPPTLWVDEAAAIPAARLGDWLERFPRLAFATTVHGYEGTGRGFEVRLRARLDSVTPDWRRLEMKTPVRWGDDDPLEALTRSLLCLDADIARPPRVTRALENAAVGYRWLDRDALAADDPLLERVFGLLVQAHYRTAPSDLRQLLDGPDVHLLAAEAGGLVVGLCVVQQEGGFDAALAGEIHHGRRRPRGHLLAQSLAAHGGFLEAAEAHLWRVMRIAVHPEARRQGVGAGLIERAAKAARAHGIEHLGASFGAEPELIRFWRAQDFRSLRIGLTREASSGEPALMMGRGLTAEAQSTIARMNHDFVRLLPDLLATELDSIEPFTAALLLHEGSAPAIDAEIERRLGWFAEGGGALPLVRPWLREAWLAWWRRQPLEKLDACDALTGTDIAAMAAMLFALRADVSAGLPAAARREREATARQWARRLLGGK